MNSSKDQVTPTNQLVGFISGLYNVYPIEMAKVCHLFHYIWSSMKQDIKDFVSQKRRSMISRCPKC
jgi:hypothetical protein